MKKMFISMVFLLGCIFVSCASTEQVVVNPELLETETSVTKSETTVGADEKLADEKSVSETETVSAETKALETKSTETNAAEIKTEEESTAQTGQEEKSADKTEVAESTITDSEKKVEPTVEEINFDDKEYLKEAASLDAACKIAKFNLVAPKTFAVYKPEKFSAITGIKINVHYVNTKNKEEKLIVRKGGGNLDVSEDSSDYSVVQLLNYGGIWIWAKGDADEEFNVATWTSGDYAYSVETNRPFPREVLFALIQDLY